MKGDIMKRNKFLLFLALLFLLGGCAGQETSLGVELLCENALMGNIIDRFGEQVHTEVVDGRHFKVITTADLSNNFYGWVFASAGKIRILAPQEVIAGFETLVKCYQ